MKYLSLFTGFGGMDLGLDRAGWECVGQVEENAYARLVLERHWPGLKRMNNVRNVRGDEFGPFNAVVGGPPCQPVSQNGRKKGEADERWLWPEFFRIIRAVGPEWIVLENVSALLVRGIGSILGDLASVGYDAEWDCVPAAVVGTPHLRDRVFLVSYPAGAGPQRKEPAGRVWGRGVFTQRDWWPAEPDVCRVAHGIPDRVERTRGLGNAVVPDVAEWIGRRIMEYEEKLKSDGNSGTDVSAGSLQCEAGRPGVTSTETALTDKGSHEETAHAS